MTTATAAVPFPVAAGTRLLGEVISWTCSGVSVTYAARLAALADAALDEGVARELAPKHAFTRACKKLCDRRIIRQVAEDGSRKNVAFSQHNKQRRRKRRSFRRNVLPRDDQGTADA